WRGRRTKVSASGSAIRGQSSVVASALVLPLCLTFIGTSAPPAPAPVYVLPGPPHDPSPHSVLAAPELIEQLRTLSRGAIPVNGTLLLEARYAGRIGDDSVDFEAHFQIHCWSDEKALIQLPLSGIRLRQALLDGAATWPRTSGPDRLTFDV